MTAINSYETKHRYV